jgi:hypothetical protein
MFCLVPLTILVEQTRIRSYFTRTGPFDQHFSLSFMLLLSSCEQTIFPAISGHLGSHFNFSSSSSSLLSSLLAGKSPSSPTLLKCHSIES